MVDGWMDTNVARFLSPVSYYWRVALLLYDDGVDGVG